MPLGTGLSPCCCGGCLTLVSEDWSPFKPVASRGGPSGPEEETSSGSSSSSAPGPWPIPADWTGNDWQVVWTTRDDNDEPIGFAACTTSATILFSTVPIDHTEHPNINARVQMRVDGNEFTGTEFRWWFGCSGGNDGYYVGVKYVQFVESTGLWKIEFGLYNYGGALVRPSTTKYVTDEYVRNWVWSFCLWEDTSAVVDTEDSSVSDTTFRERNITVTAGWDNPLDVTTYAVVGNVPIRDLGTRHGIEAVPSDGTRICVESYVVTESETTDCPHCFQDCRSCENDDAPKYLKVQFDGYGNKDRPDFWCDCANRIAYYEYIGGCSWQEIPCCRTAGQDCQFPSSENRTIDLFKDGSVWRLRLLSDGSPNPTVLMQSSSLGESDKVVKCSEFMDIRLNAVGTPRPNTCDSLDAFAVVSVAGSDAGDPYTFQEKTRDGGYTFDVSPWGCNAKSPRAMLLGIGGRSYLIDTKVCQGSQWTYINEDGTVDAGVSLSPVYDSVEGKRVSWIMGATTPETGSVFVAPSPGYYGAFRVLLPWPIAPDAFLSNMSYRVEFVAGHTVSVPYGIATLECIPW